ncbi:MAG: DUF3370 domain-containing protein [Kastovskya adunca ATA6-11-RM4]|jgi:hypothetical protein|nr:DUF3370 domain-containing protein [Kastovskya adunca ATA6-11-RM4]
MLSLLPIFSLAQIAPIPIPVPPPNQAPSATPEVVIVPYPIRALPGELDDVFVFNSNSPEVIETEGILLSTLPSDGKAVPGAHLDFALSGRFDIFAHHIARANTPEGRPVYLGIVVYNPGKRPVTVNVQQVVSYLTHPDAPFVDLPSLVENPDGKVYSGPGSRVMNDILRGVRQTGFPSQVVIPPGESKMLLNVPIPISSARSTLMRLRSNGKVHVASLAMFPQLDSFNKEDNPTTPSYRAPLLAEWQQLLKNGKLAEPRDRAPTPPDETDGHIIYGRVAGVAQGSQWQSEIVDRPGKKKLTIPEQGQAFSYALSTVTEVTLGTGQVQSAALRVRYPDTAYRAHGNYGVHYSLSLPLHNATRETQRVTVSLQTPLKREDRQNQLYFLQNPAQEPIFFRGTVQVTYKNDRGQESKRYVHLVQRRGQRGDPLVTLNLEPDEQRLVKIDFLYPPDATPPQVLTVTTLS